jgi:hypothetical protein
MHNPLSEGLQMRQATKIGLIGAAAGLGLAIRALG